VAIHFKCPSPKCGKFIQVGDAMAGKMVVCPTCKRQVAVPTQSSQQANGEPTAYEEFLVGMQQTNAPAPAQQAAVKPQPRPAAEETPEDDSGFDNLAELAVAEHKVTAPAGKPTKTAVSWTHIVPLTGSFLRHCLRAIRHPGVDVGKVAAAVFFIAVLETYRRELLARIPQLPAEWWCRELATVGGVLMFLVLGGYCLSVCLALASAAVAGGRGTEAGVRLSLLHVIRTGMMGVCVLVIYVLPVVTLPLLPVALLTLSMTGHARTLDLRRQVRSAFQYGEAFAVLWLVLVCGIALVVAGWWVLIAASGLLAAHVGELMAGVEGEATAGVVMFLGAMVAAVPTFLLACGMFRCIGLLGRSRPAVLESMPTGCPRAVTCVVAVACLALLLYVAYLLT